MNAICYCEKCTPLHKWIGEPVPSGICKVCGEEHGVDLVINYCNTCLDVVLKERRDSDKIVQNIQIDI